MLLDRLREYADKRLEMAPSLYVKTPIAAIVELKADGSPASPVPTMTVDPSTARGKRGIERLAPDVVRTVGIQPLLLADNGEYTFGIARDAAKQARADASHAAYRALLERCADDTMEPAVAAVALFYEKGGAGLLSLTENWDYGHKVTFRVHLPEGPVLPIDLPSVQRFWASVNTGDSAEATVLSCIVCGAERPVLRVLTGKIKGVRGGQSSGTSIISANAEAFESYGLESSYIAPTCAECGEKFTVALNSLIAGESSRVYLADSTFVFWTRRAESELPFGALLSNPSEADMKALLKSFGRGRKPAPLDEDHFFSVSLSGSGGRTVVRDWIDTTVGAAKDSVARWFELQSIVDPYGQPPEPLGLFPLAASVVRKVDDLPKTVPRAMLHAAISGTPLPLDLAYQAVRRNRAEQEVTRPRAALLKLVLLSRRTDETPEGYMVSLQVDHPEPAYHLGRLLAVLEQIQRAALPGVSATIVDRFFGTASSAPAGVFGRLIRGAQPHLSRLERDRPSTFAALQRRMEEVLATVDGFPRTLTLEQQGIFALGYYHQRAHDRAQAMARRDAGATNPEPNLDEETTQ